MPSFFSLFLLSLSQCVTPTPPTPSLLSFLFLAWLVIFHPLQFPSRKGRGVGRRRSSSLFSSPSSSSQSLTLHPTRNNGNHNNRNKKEKKPKKTCLQFFSSTSMEPKGEEAMVRDAKLESGSSQQPPAFICQLGVKVNGRTPLICGFETTSFEALLLHEGIVHLKTLHPCLKCNLRFGSRLEFRRHCRRCPHNQPCNFCPQRFPTQASLTYHCLQRHPSLYIKPLPNSQDPR